MRETKLFEVRDRMTFMPILAIRVDGDGDPLLRRAGFNAPAVILIPLEGACRHQWSYDPFSWVTLARTIPRAHVHIIDNWSSLPDGAVIDVEFISGETPTPKESEASDGRTDKNQSEAERLVRYCRDQKSTIAQRAEIEAALDAKDQHDCIERLFDFKTKLEAADSEIERLKAQNALNLQLANEQNERNKERAEAAEAKAAELEDICQSSSDDLAFLDECRQRAAAAEAEAKMLRAGLEEVARQAHECGDNYNFGDIESTARAILDAKR